MGRNRRWWPRPPSEDTSLGPFHVQLDEVEPCEGMVGREGVECFKPDNLGVGDDDVGKRHSIADRVQPFMSEIGTEERRGLPIRSYRATSKDSTLDSPFSSMLERNSSSSRLLGSSASTRPFLPMRDAATSVKSPSLAPTSIRSFRL